MDTNARAKSDRTPGAADRGPESYTHLSIEADLKGEVFGDPRLQQGKDWISLRAYFDESLSFTWGGYHLKTNSISDSAMWASGLRLRRVADSDPASR